MLADDVFVFNDKLHFSHVVSERDLQSTHSQKEINSRSFFYNRKPFLKENEAENCPKLMNTLRTYPKVRKGEERFFLFGNTAQNHRIIFFLGRCLSVQLRL